MSTERSAGEIASYFSISAPAVSQHRVLKRARLVSERRSCRRRLHRANPEALADLRQFLDEFWGERLELLKQEAEQAERDRR